MLRVERSFLFNYHDHVGGQIKEKIFMAFFNSAVTAVSYTHLMREARSRMKEELDYRMNEKQENTIRLKKQGRMGDGRILE